MKTLHLILTHRWYDMIERGEKPEEYRDMKWIKRICERGTVNGHMTHCAWVCPNLKPACRDHVPTPYTHVCFHRGYTKTTMLWCIDNITIGRGNPDWGAPHSDAVIIKLKPKNEVTS